MDPAGSECGGLDDTHSAFLTGGQSTEMWDHEAGRHSNRQHQETLSIPRFTGKVFIAQVEGLGEKGKKYS